MNGRQRCGVLTLTVLMLGASAMLAGCTQDAPPVIEVDSSVGLVDEPLHIRVTGITTDGPVSVAAMGFSSDSRVWLASAEFRADDAGVIDLTKAAPESGSYSGVDGMGLFWSMSPDVGDANEIAFEPHSADGGRSYEIRLSAAVDGEEVASTTVRRVFTAADVQVRPLTIDQDGVVGYAFTPPVGSAKRPGVLLLGGSEGGPGPIASAALFASRGYPSLALSYFDQPGLPPRLADIPVEYFATAARRLGQEPSVDATSVVAWGYSRGTEAAMLLAEFYPELVRAVVLYAPTQQVNPGFPGGGVAWTHDNVAVPPGRLPVVHVAGPVLAIAGGADEVWAAGPAAKTLVETLDAAHPGQRHDVLLYPLAGHGVGSYPNVATAIVSVHPMTKAALRAGGTRAGDASARADGYPKVLAFLEALAAS